MPKFLGLWTGLPDAGDTAPLGEQHLIGQWVGKQPCILKDLESLAGKQAHALKVVQPGKTFMCRTYELLGGIHQPHHHIHVNTSFQSDIHVHVLWSDTFRKSWNGVSMLHSDGYATISSYLDRRIRLFWMWSLWAYIITKWIQMEWPDEPWNGVFQFNDGSITLKVTGDSSPTHGHFP